MIPSHVLPDRRVSCVVTTGAVLGPFPLIGPPVCGRIRGMRTQLSALVAQEFFFLAQILFLSTGDSSRGTRFIDFAAVGVAA